MNKDFEEYEVIPTGLNADGDLDTHTSSYGFCQSDPSCPCHEDGDLIAEVATDYYDGLLTDSEANALVDGRNI